MATNELPTRGNKRGGPGWWMDLDGVWRAPQQWPEDTPPLDGWIRSSDGQWHAPTPVSETEDDERDPVTIADNADKSSNADGAPRRSRQAEADRKAMFTVVGVIAAALLLLAAALILITQASAEDIPEAADEGGSVVFAAETDEVKMQRRLAAATEAPAVARAQLDALPVRPDVGELDDLAGYDLIEWTAERTDCLDIAEEVLVERSQSPVLWADKLECVPDQGRWSDRYLSSTITRTLDADVTLHVPTAVAYASGGDAWTPTTRQAYLTDTDHPATLEVVTAGSGHNPRGQDPAEWKPSAPSTWCAYAIDWVAVKSRWELSITAAERDALTEMLDSCAEASSTGPDLLTMVIDDIAAPTIERTAGLAE